MLQLTVQSDKLSCIHILKWHDKLGHVSFQDCHLKHILLIWKWNCFATMAFITENLILQLNFLESRFHCGNFQIYIFCLFWTLYISVSCHCKPSLWRDPTCLVFYDIVRKVSKFACNRCKHIKICYFYAAVHNIIYAIFTFCMLLQRRNLENVDIRVCVSKSSTGNQEAIIETV